MKPRLLLAIAIVIGGAVVLPGAVARAAVVTSCSVSGLSWSTADGGRLQFKCDTADYKAPSTPTAASLCPAIDVNSQRAWFSLALAALLSGRPLYLEYTTCEQDGAWRGLTYVRLK